MYTVTHRSKNSKKRVHCLWDECLLPSVSHPPLSFPHWQSPYTLHCDEIHSHHHWHNSPFWAKAFFRSFCQLSPFLAAFLQFLSPNFLASSIIVLALPFAFFLLLLRQGLFLLGSAPLVELHVLPILGS